MSATVLLKGVLLENGLYGLFALGIIYYGKNLVQKIKKRFARNGLSLQEIKSLQLSEEQYRTLVENQGEGVAVVNENEKVTYANSSAEAIFGLPAEGYRSLAGCNLSEFTSPENYTLIQEQTGRRRNGEKGVYELEIIRPSGEKRTLLVTMMPRFDNDNRYTGSFGTLVDITRRKKDELILRENQERYQALYKAAQRQTQELSLLACMHTALSRELELPEVYRVVVEGIAETFGYTQVSIYLLQNDLLVVEHQVGYQNIINPIPINQGISGRVARTAQPVLLEDVYSDPDFISAVEDVTSEVCVPLIDQGQVIGTLNIESIHGVQLTEADLRLMITLSEHVSLAIGRARLYTQACSSEASYRALANNLPGIVFRHHVSEGRVEFFNKMLEEITGYTPAEIRRGRFCAVESLVSIEDRKRVNLAICDAIEKNHPYEIEYRVRHKNGSMHYCIERGRPVNRIEGGTVCIDGVILDQTERRNAEEQLTHYARQMEALYATSLAINAQPDLSALLENIVEQAVQMIGMPMGGLYMIQPGSNKLELLVHYNLPENFLGVSLELGEGLTGKVAQTGRPMFTTNYSEWKDGTIYRQIHTKRLLAVPLKVKGKVIGVINITDTQSEQPFSEEDVRLVSLFADQAAIAVDNARLYAHMELQAILDELTGLYNRRGLMDLGGREVERAERFGRLLSAIFVDIDRFKEFNDRYSHAVGDQVLALVARTLKEGIREVDLIGRYGGEEFIILLVETGLEAAQEVAERLRVAVESTRALTIHGELGVTVSMGVSQSLPGTPDLNALIHRADEAMYKAKLVGRNCVVADPD